jgi:hypothetical protein
MDSTTQNQPDGNHTPGKSIQWVPLRASMGLQLVKTAAIALQNLVEL